MHKSPSAMLRLVWKEAIQVRPLAIALLVLGVMIYAIQWLWGSNSYDAISILLPNLFALGASVLMIGHEEETGTLAWSRTLPIRWGQAFWSRWIVAAVGLAIAWGISLFLYALLTPASGRAYHQHWLIHQTLYLLTFSYTLLAAGFMLSWWIRKPIPTLFLLMVLMGGVSTLSIAAAQAISGSYNPRAEDSAPLLAAAGVVMALLSAWFANRTWNLPWERRRTRPKAQEIPTIRPYRPLESVPLLSPSAPVALLWQQAMQSLPIVAPAFALGLSAAVLPLITGASPQHAPWQVLGTALAILVLGAATFLTDNTGRRHRFLADRGLSTWTVWWTRQLVPLALSLVIIALAALTLWETLPAGDPERIGSVALMVSLLMAAYICGQLTSLVVQRSIVALLAAPLVLIGLCVSTIPLLELFGFLPSMLGWMIAGLLVLWMTTLRLCRRWMDEQRNAGFYGRALGWLGIAAMFSFGGFFAQRWVTIPPAMPDWQQQVLRESARLPDLPLASRSPRFVSSSSYESVLESPNTALSPQTVERHALPFQQMFNANPALEGYHPQRIEGHAALLEASLRTVAIYRDTETLHLSDLADALEFTVASELASPRGRAELSQDQWQSLVDRLATTEQRRAARRRALLRSYQDFASPESTFREGISSDTASSMLGGYYVMGMPRHVLGMERLRTRRLVDRAVRRSLEDLQQWPAPSTQRMNLWQAAWQDRYYSYGMLPTLPWQPESDTLIARLKAEPASS